MTLQAVCWAFDQELPCAHKFVLVALADMTDSDDCCWPSQTFLAERCGLSRQYVNKVLGDLERDRYIAIASRSRPNGSDASCRYQLMLPPEMAAVEAPRQQEPGFVYVIVGDKSVKIGITRDLDRRIYAIRSATGDKTLALVESWAMGMVEARRIEKAAHDYFESKRLHGEWFDIKATEAVAKIKLLVSTERTPPCVNREDTPVSTKETPHFVLTSQKEPTPHTPRKRGANVEGFEAWWQGYPRKVGKDDALKAWAKALALASVEELTAGRDRYAADCATRGTEEQFIKHASRWLNGKCWLDEPSKKSNGNGASNGLMSYDEPWPQRVRSWKRDGVWMFDQWGPRPGEPGCRAPPELVA